LDKLLLNWNFIHQESHRV